ncbi:MAG: hypothetical protein ACTHJ7_10705 [Candidatus Nitrosocosmicus sp.]
MLKYELVHNNTAELTSNMALAAIQQEHKGLESPVELDPFSLFINAKRDDQTRRKYQA